MARTSARCASPGSPRPAGRWWSDSRRTSAGGSRRRCNASARSASARCDAPSATSEIGFTVLPRSACPPRGLVLCARTPTTTMMPATTVTRQPSTTTTSRMVASMTTMAATRSAMSAAIGAQMRSRMLVTGSLARVNRGSPRCGAPTHHAITVTGATHVPTTMMAAEVEVLQPATRGTTLLSSASISADPPTPPTGRLFIASAAAQAAASGATEVQGPAVLMLSAEATANARTGSGQASAVGDARTAGRPCRALPAGVRPYRRRRRRRCSGQFRRRRRQSLLQLRPGLRAARRRRRRRVRPATDKPHAQPSPSAQLGRLSRRYPMRRHSAQAASSCGTAGVA